VLCRILRSKYHCGQKPLPSQKNNVKRNGRRPLLKCYFSDFDQVLPHLDCITSSRHKPSQSQQKNASLRPYDLCSSVTFLTLNRYLTARYRFIFCLWATMISCFYNGCAVIRISCNNLLKAHSKTFKHAQLGCLCRC